VLYTLCMLALGGRSGSGGGETEVGAMVSSMLQLGGGDFGDLNEGCDC
jgi:hypothetical protein